MPIPVGGVTCIVKLAVNGNVRGFGTVGGVTITVGDAAVTTDTAVLAVTIFPNESVRVPATVNVPAIV
jgi:hypothetical protein